jgi:hypothetical protein
MAWTTPLTAVANAVLTAAQWNASVRDNLLETAPAKFTAAGQLFVSTGANAGATRTPVTSIVSASQTTTSGSYVDLTTVGPAASPTTGTAAIVSLSSSIGNSSAAATLMSFAISGATTVAASDPFAIGHDSIANYRLGGLFMVTGLTPGTNTFTAKYRVSGGTGTFLDRKLIVLPL